jgi:leukotriene-A4 hydrolase
MKLRLGNLLSGLLIASSGITSASASIQDQVCEQVLYGAEDPHSFSRPSEVTVTHLDFDLEINFEDKKISGDITYQLVNHTGTETLVLDTRALTIRGVWAGSEPVEFALGAAHPLGGQPLVIHLPPGTTQIRISYETRPEGNALQWLDPEQVDGTSPFLYTKSSPDRARSWFPCQDTPSVRTSYTAQLKTRSDLLPLMSASNPTRRNRHGSYHFDMPQPIPSYLIALAVGNLRFKKIDERLGVYAIPSLINPAHWEFSPSPEIMSAAEKLYGPYLWGRWDLLIMPSSYPIGGMENPRLNFFTPTLIRGDRSGLSVVAHELGHAWSGNKVTNASWNEVWLNEGMTSYAEYRLSEAVFGEDFANMIFKLGVDGLIEEMKTMKPEDTHLYLDLRGRDPYDGFSSVAYDKGFLFLRMCELTVGRARWDAFIKGYFDAYAFKSITTVEFLKYMEDHLIQGDSALRESLRIQEWVYGPGLPANSPVIQSNILDQVQVTAQEWLAGKKASELNTQGWVAQAWEYFLKQLPEGVAASRMAELDAAFGFTSSRNVKIAGEWLKHAIASHYGPGEARIESFLMEVGNTYLLKRMYGALAKTPEGREQALAIFAKARSRYHSQTVKAICTVLGIQ